MGINRNIVECKDIHWWIDAVGLSVLIETLWNVKIIEFQPILYRFPSINRNIVECKVVRLLTAWQRQHRINRNIVECKGVSRWEIYAVQVGINRNIVECKACNCNCHMMVVIVLIETLWNVKEYSDRNMGNDSMVLIETLWNVKDYRLKKILDTQRY